MANCKNAQYKNNIMKECMEEFYNPNFNKLLNSNKYLIAFQNGIYDLKKNEFREGYPHDYISMKLGVNYTNLSKNNKSVQNVHDFINKVFPDKSLREYFLDNSSDVFVGGNMHKIVLFWSGDGDNAKSVTQMMFEKMLGEYSVKLPTSLIIGKRTQSSAACPELARSGNGVRWAVMQEPDKKDIINIGILKELSGNDTFFARGLYKEGGEVTPMFKLLVICNEAPSLPNSDKATWNRIRVLPFEASFKDNAPEDPEEQLKLKKFPRDTNFEDKIPGMIDAFAWVLLAHRKKNLLKKRVEPEKVKLATQAYQRKNDIYKQFMDENIKENPKSKISLTTIYTEFKDWFKESFPHRNIPVKGDVKEYLERRWGEPEVGIKWKGYQIRTLDEDFQTGHALELGDSDLED